MSNLIEQLGGYEAAKRAIENGVLKDWAPCTYEVARRELLEYRRANNIFEVGDWIFIAGTTDISQFIGYAHKGTHAELPQIKLNGVLYSSCFSAWVHATDEEIKAGHRLPQLEVLDDIDIPPNTIILGDK